MKPVFFLPASQPMGPHGAVSAFSPPPGSPGRVLSWPSQERTAEATPKSLSLFSRAPRIPMACHGLSNRPRFPTGRHGLTRNAYGMRARSSQPGWGRGTARGARMRRFRACGGFSFGAYHIELGVAIAKTQGSRLISEKIMKSRLRSHFSHFRHLNYKKSHFKLVTRSAFT